MSIKGVVALISSCLAVALLAPGSGQFQRLSIASSGLEAQTRPPSIEKLASGARKISLKAPGGHLMGGTTRGMSYTSAMSDGTPAPKLVVDPDGAIFLGYNDADSNARILELDGRLRVKREVLRVKGKRLADFIAVDDALTLLLTEFDSEKKQNYVRRKHHTAHIEQYAIKNGRANFRTRIVGTREYKKEGDQGIDTTFGTFSIAYDEDNEVFATYFSTYRRWDDGVTHQSEYLATFDADDGKRRMQDGNRPEGFTWNVSHSFRPRFVHDGERYVMATVGDAYPRGLVVQFFAQGESGGRELPIKVPKAKPGETYQYVPVTTGDLYARDNNTWIVVDSAVGRSSNDIALIRAQGEKVGKPIFLTNTPRVRERVPRIQPYGEDHLLVLWMNDQGPAKRKWHPELSKMAMQGAVIDEAGRVISKPAAFGKIGQFQMRSAARMFRLSDGRAGWINDATGIEDQLEIVVLPGPGGGGTVDPDENEPDEKPEPPESEENETIKIDPKLNQPLLAAIYDGEDRTALSLLQRGADPNAKFGQWTALLYAAYFGRTSVVEELVRRKANPNATVSGWTALRLAESRGHDRIVETLRPITQINSRAFGREAAPARPTDSRVRTRGGRVNIAPNRLERSGGANSRAKLRELGKPKQ
ncbi:MAG: ankyrin repeat domain-containing protein [bacterium]|nr:ankyrin repeat domain-containing protein [bacterium]